ncbi:N-formylglutamate amidohydrolase [Bosea caraganae]|uniref:N-formylglutamate amidohydrolase n=1 Tax=Bosea caraganae TaxID=2763117 RepID=A0A370LAB5_9HYPH|nr:N-formylglutamate amidohydrolase [Bosea caraganae]RDJ21727.1 N-formylglutamate amidohydrolase [Bosea caraganae]RDJ28242.1 N-formylglutamate amidohydrolase [Bosea caraganae]
MRSDSLAAGSVLPLAPGEVEIISGDPATGMLLLCDHASNAMPPELNSLGLPPEQLERHIAYDIGAAELTRAMAHATGAPALLTNFSRLLIDPNRGLDDPTLVMRLSDGAIVPGNARIDEAGIAARVAKYYAPYDAAIDDAIETAIATGHLPAIVSIHSFTPFWKAVARPWHVGVLWDHEGALAQALIAALQAEGDLVVGDNEPYNGGLPGDTIDRHATRRGLPDALIEVRQDLIASPETARAWGLRLARIVPPVVAALRDGAS